MNSSFAMCGVVPTPPWPTLSTPGLALAIAISSATDLAAMPGCTTSASQRDAAERPRHDRPSAQAPCPSTHRVLPDAAAAVLARRYIPRASCARLVAMRHAFRGSPFGEETFVDLSDAGLDVTDGTTR